MKLLDSQEIRYVFLDRDGVLNRKPAEGSYISDWAQFEWLPGAREAVARMNRAHCTVIVVTNQRGVALGLYSETRLQQIHSQMEKDLAEFGAHLDAIYYCPHDRGQCLCRKPESGLFTRAFARFRDAGAQNSIVIGDSISDIEAGRRLGMKTIFVRGEVTRQKSGAGEAEEMADAVVVSLEEATDILLAPHTPLD